MIMHLLVGLALAASAPVAQRGRPPVKPARKPVPVQTQTTTPAPAQTQASKPESVHDRASYAIGLNLGRNLKASEAPVSPELIMRGLRDALAGTSALTDEEMQAAMQAFQQELLAAQEARSKSLAAKNKTEGDAFLAANKSKPGVVTTASGLQYVMLKEGSGANPKATDQVTIQYKGTLIDGTTFDSSIDRGQPATFGVNQVIPGMAEGLQLLKPGGKIKLFIPPALGYGERGAGNDIGPNAVLIFEVELLSIGANP